MMNVINLLDGMDGLAAGISAIAGATFAILALELGRPEAAVLSAIVCGACLGFLRHNFYPARIFMGDSGSHLLGFILAAVAIQGSLKTAATVALIFPLIVLAVPILDTSFVIAKRLKYGRPSYGADPVAPVPPLPQHRLHPAPRRPVLLRLGRRAGRRGARLPLRALPEPRRVAPLADRARGRRSASSWSRPRSTWSRARDPQGPAPARLGRPAADRRA